MLSRTLRFTARSGVRRARMLGPMAAERAEAAAHLLWRVRSAAARRTSSRGLSTSGKPTEVDLEQVLVGGQGGVSARAFASKADWPWWPSTTLADSPHHKLARGIMDGGQSTGELVVATGYQALAKKVIEVRGNFFGVTHLDGLEENAVRRFDALLGGQGSTSTGTGQSTPGSLPVVRPIRRSPCYQVIDGHHRLAAELANGRSSAVVRVLRSPVSTPLQEHLLRMSWLEGRPLIYQPLPQAEVQSWNLVRSCQDRRDAMETVIRRELGEVTGLRYLDVASCYGWFLAEMESLGMLVTGIERDVHGPVIGEIGYGITRDHVVTDDVFAAIDGPLARQRWDVVSCFSLAHHFLLNDDFPGFVRLLRLLDSVTTGVLFFEMGEGHEGWFRARLAGWHPERIESELREHTTFERIEALRTDDDGVGRYEGNYGRTLFACVRARPQG
jgi:hypothetical protein